MNPQQNRFEIEPELSERVCGGWLAVAPCEAALRIGVVAKTELEARERFRQSVERWLANLQAAR